MLNAIVDWAVRSRLLVVIGLFAAVIVAVFTIPRLNLDAFPDVSNVQVVINTEAPGLAAEEVEQLISFPIEATIYSLPSVEEVRSISRTGLSVITVVFEEGTDIYFARQLVFEQLQAAREQIPEGVGQPEMGPNTSGLSQVYEYVLTSENPEKYGPMELRSLNDWVVKLLMMPVEGVTGLLSYGGEVRQYQVKLNPAKLLSYDLTADDVTEAINAGNRNAGGWYVNRGSEQLVIRGVGWVRSGKDGLRDISNVPVKEVDGTAITVGDVAEVAYGGEIRQGAVTMTKRTADGEVQAMGEVVAGIVLKRFGANTAETITDIEELLPTIQKALPEGVRIEPYYNQSDLVFSAVDTVVDALLQAFVFIVIILALFLLNLRASLLVLLSIPISVGLALMVMSYFGMSANLMSLGGLAIAIGMMVDGSIVVMENIFSHISRPDRFHDSERRRELTPDDSGTEIDHDQAEQDDPQGVSLRIAEATKEVARSVFFAVMIIVVVFLPLFTLQGVEGKMFTPMAISIVLAELAALGTALVVVPALASYFFRRGIHYRPSPILKPLEAGYRWLLDRAIRFRSIVAGTAIVMLAFAIFLIPRLGTEFMPEMEEGTMMVRVTLAPSVNVDAAVEIAPKLEKRIMKFPEVTYVTSRIGRAELGGDPEPVSNIAMYIGLKPAEQWESAEDREGLQALIQEELSVHPGLILNFSQPIANRVDELLSGVKAQLAIKLFGPDLDILAEKGQAIETLAKSVEGTRDVQMEQIAGEAQLIVRPDRDRLARYGISVAQVMELVSDAIGGQSAGQVIKGNERYDIYVRLAEQYRNSAESIRSLILQAPNGAWVRLEDVAEVAIEEGPPQIRRDDVQRRVVVQANIEGRDMGGVVAELDRRIAEEVDLPAGYSVVFGGQFENQRRAQQTLMIVVPISLALIFLFLYFAFGSVGQALLIMLNVPLALIGGVVSLWITGQYLSVPSSIGFITLFGLAVLNGVVMISAINQRVEGGLPPAEAAFEGALTRLRPVMMTAFTSALGLIPMLMASGIGSDVQRPLASVVVGGLVSATLLTLVVLPALYQTFSRGWIRDHTHEV
ncbi:MULTISPECIES: efflux RND transporter permease subunit [Marinobacter]|uniref:efflux RND transporter permease subunit n=1 Tax=Marinobacter TaxID=2742 RepID=UPI0020062C9C|nr:MULTISPECIES: CusA/CzcA family heavy metal efflux RND transporter [Marinobacter]MCK7544793.1 CusA/CzcA family heavy metal efflux RND transporter [Marinobacter bryozoorum]UZD66630.1 CusA/CzcA family heavy metal efflux RND transporter [Marinobacter sp. AN1]